MRKINIQKTRDKSLEERTKRNENELRGALQRHLPVWLWSIVFYSLVFNLKEKRSRNLDVIHWHPIKILVVSCHVMLLFKNKFRLHHFIQVNRDLNPFYQKGKMSSCGRPAAAGRSLVSGHPPVLRARVSHGQQEHVLAWQRFGQIDEIPELKVHNHSASLAVLAPGKFLESLRENI